MSVNSRSQPAFVRGVLLEGEGLLRGVETRAQPTNMRVPADGRLARRSPAGRSAAAPFVGSAAPAHCLVHHPGEQEDLLDLLLLGDAAQLVMEGNSDLGL